ncbi:heparanase-like protein 1 [Panicum miliaceum]|uniref:Heparanase-like protein 1 n=1 Tax=Panicum miliaceum TaxID=4540 RepID=A0A3L6SV17_PANMI|nr:heparanase-like protein 1 [Panicum miliaceum]
MLLNGVPLELGDDGSVPAINPVLVVVDSSLYLAPTSIAFVVLPSPMQHGCVTAACHGDLLGSGGVRRLVRPGLRAGSCCNLQA